MATYEQYCRLVAPHLVHPQPARQEPEMLLPTLIADLVKRALDETSDKPSSAEEVPSTFCPDCGCPDSFTINSTPKNDFVMCSACGSIRSIEE